MICHLVQQDKGRKGWPLFCPRSLVSSCSYTRGAAALSRPLIHHGAAALQVQGGRGPYGWSGCPVYGCLRKRREGQIGTESVGVTDSHYYKVQQIEGHILGEEGGEGGVCFHTLVNQPGQYTEVRQTTRIPLVHGGASTNRMAMLTARGRNMAKQGGPMSCTA